MIRRATMQDIDAIVALGREVYERSPYAERLGRFNEYEAKMALVRYVGDRRDSFVAVSDRGGVDGFIVATSCKMPFAMDSYAADIAFCSKGGRGLALLRALQAWARDRDEPLLMGNGFGDPRVDRLYEHIGLTRAGSLYTGQ